MACRVIKPKPFLWYVAWGVGLAAIAGALQQLGHTGTINAVQLCGSGLMGGFLGSIVGKWKRRHTP